MLHFFLEMNNVFRLVIWTPVNTDQHLHGVVVNEQYFSEKGFPTLLPIYSL